MPRVIQRQCEDASQRDTLHALENVVALIVGEEQGYRFGQYKQWEADFLRHLLGHTSFEEEQAFNEKSQENFRFCDVSRSLQMRVGKKFTSLLRHGRLLAHEHEMYPNGAVDMYRVFDCCGNDVNPLQQFTEGRQFAAFLQGNNKQRFFIEVYLNENWNLGRDLLPWKIYIGCTQGHSTGVVQPIESAHKLSIVEMYSFGWIFHVTDQKYEKSIYCNGLRRYNRDSLHFMYHNDGMAGYIRKGAGTKPPRHYGTTRYCILKLLPLIRDGFGLFLASNGMILIYDDLPLDYFHSVDQFPYVGFNAFSRTSGHGLPPEVQLGAWRSDMSVQQKYEEYLSSDEISKYLENDQQNSQELSTREKTNSMGVHGPGST